MESYEPKSGLVAMVGVVSAVLLVAVIILLQALYYRAAAKEDLTRHRLRTSGGASQGKRPDPGQSSPGIARAGIVRSGLQDQVLFSDFELGFGT